MLRNLSLVCLLIINADSSMSLHGQVSRVAPTNTTESRYFDITLSRHDSDFVKWASAIGHRTASISVSGNSVLIGTNELVFGDSGLPTIEKGGTLICVDKLNGQKKWLLTHPRRGELEIPFHGIRSFATIECGYVFYVTNRGELVCADIDGVYDRKDDGIRAKPPETETSGDIVWILDMEERLDVFRGNEYLGNPICTPLIVGEFVYCITGNGSSWGRRNPLVASFLPRPDSPSFICVKKRSGELVWSKTIPGKELVFSWSSPVCSEVDGKKSIIFPGGDGRLYAFDPVNGDLQWQYDLNNRDATLWNENVRGTRTFCVATPVVRDGVLYVSSAQDVYAVPIAPILALDLSRLSKSNEQKAKVAELWSFAPKGFKFTNSSPVILDDSVFIYCEETATVYAVNRKSGQVEGFKAINFGGRPKRFNALHFVKEFNAIVAITDTSLEFFSATSELNFLGRLRFESKDLENGSIENSIIGPPVLDNSILYVPAARFVFAVELALILDTK